MKIFDKLQSIMIRRKLIKDLKSEFKESLKNKSINESLIRRYHSLILTAPPFGLANHVLKLANTKTVDLMITTKNDVFISIYISIISINSEKNKIHVKYTHNLKSKETLMDVRRRITSSFEFIDEISIKNCATAVNMHQATTINYIIEIICESALNGLNMIERW